jgi:hypothetical protein
VRKRGEGGREGGREGGKEGGAYLIDQRQGVGGVEPDTLLQFFGCLVHLPLHEQELGVGSDDVSVARGGFLGLEGGREGGREGGVGECMSRKSA